MPNWPVGPFIHALLLQMLTEPPWSAGCRAGGKATVAKDAPLSQSSRSEGGGWRSRENQTSRRNCVRKKINGMGEATLPGKDTLGSALKTTGAQALGETRVNAPRQESSSVGGFKKHRGPGGWGVGGEAVEAGSGQDLRGRGKRFVFH